MSATAEQELGEAMIERLVRAFYARIRVDPVLAPIFVAAIPGDWEPHLARMCEFWSSVMLTSGRYRGNPVAVHKRLSAVRPEHFERWLALFEQTAGDICPPEIAAEFMIRARRIAASLKNAMFYDPARMAPS
tara:strand:- start:30 stop:425 length:396 start_codon:yes stop_codon:yes gene_type:complete